MAASTRPGAFAPTKTAAGTRIIPVGEWVLDELNLHLQQFGAGDGGVIVHTDGRPVDSARWGHYMREARKHAGMSDRVSFHDLRHCFASALIAAGCTVKQVQAALGHESAKVTLDVYGHLWPGDDDWGSRRHRPPGDRRGEGPEKDHGLTAGAKARVRGPVWPTHKFRFNV
ncbi:MAG: tyrosine-type recombinase/integrase [Acidimicrobiales bacterium]